MAIRTEVVQALAWYRHNTSIRQIVEDIYGERAEGYLEEKMGTIVDHGLLYLYCYLDEYHQRNLVEVIDARYGDYLYECGVDRVNP